MAEPKSAEEFMQRYHQREMVSGYGSEVTMHLPCPFCAAPEFMVYRIFDVRDTMAAGATCKECGRSVKTISVPIPGGEGFEIVQTGGPEQPEWLTPKMRVLKE